MDHCIACHTPIINEINWSNVFLPERSLSVCQNCFQQLDRIKGPKCRKCHRSTSMEICTDCQHWEQLYDGKDPLTNNYSIFHYNEFIKELIATWKYRGDYVIGEFFNREMQLKYHDLLVSVLPKDTICIPIPLSAQRLHERAFNQALQLAEKIPLLVEAGSLIRTTGEKQSKKTRLERLTTINPFILQKTINKTVLLVDDIYTTGRTLRHVADILLKNGCPKVYALTLVRG